MGSWFRPWNQLHLCGLKATTKLFQTKSVPNIGARSFLDKFWSPFLILFVFSTLPHDGSLSKKNVFSMLKTCKGLWGLCPKATTYHDCENGLEGLDLPWLGTDTDKNYHDFNGTPKNVGHGRLIDLGVFKWVVKQKPLVILAFFCRMDDATLFWVGSAQKVGKCQGWDPRHPSRLVAFWGGFASYPPWN